MMIPHVLCVLFLSFGAAFAALAAQQPLPTTNCQLSTVIHVAPTGDDAADGTAARPVRSLVRARDLLRERRNGAGGGTVLLADGEYPMDETLTLMAADGGATPEAPVVWKAALGAKPRLTGGFRVRGFKPAGGEFPSGTLVADIRAQGYGDIPERMPFGYHSRNAKPPMLDLYCDGRQLTLAREPNEGRWLRSMDNPVEGATNVVRTFLHHPERFTPDKAPDLMAHGYWRFFWADEVVKAEMTDAADCRLTFRGAYAFPGSKPEAMFYLFNAPTALDMPGEWYLDRAKGLLYVLPPKDATADAAYVLTRTQVPFVTFDGASNVVLEGLSLAYGGATAITGTNGANVTIRGNAIRNFGGWGLSFANTDNLTIYGNVLDGFGRGGIDVTGGDRRTLRDGRTRIEANEIAHTGRTQRTYTAAINYSGCGLVAARNHVHDLPAHGINARGNDILIGSNVVERVCLESDDQGGSDIFGNLGFRNVRYIGNVWRDIGPKSDFATCGAGGVRLDDAISGETIRGNRFIRCAQGHFGGVQVNGGLENVIDNNLFVGCKYAVSFMYPNTDWQWKAFLACVRSQKWHHIDTEIDKPPYSTRYPQLADWPKRAKKNRVTRNVAVGAAMLLGPDAAAVECVAEQEDNVMLPTGADGEAAFAAHGFDPLPPLSAIGTPEDDPHLVRARQLAHVSLAATLNIDVGRQLFVDDFLVASTQGVVRVYNHPRKEFDGPLIVPETELERSDTAYGHRVGPSATCNSGGLWWDPRKKVFRLWYTGIWISHILYAESKDGIHWTRPDCGVVPGTNRVLPDVTPDTWCVFPDYAAADPYANWRTMVSLEGGITDNLLFKSADGIHWDSLGKAGQSGDCTTIFYDPFCANWVFSLRDYKKDVGRCRRRWTSKVFGGESCHWSWPGSKMYADCAAPEPWLEPDERDVPDLSVSKDRAQLYNVDAVAYESIMLGHFKVFYPMDGDFTACIKAGLPKITDLQFAYSRDGVHYERPDRTASIPSSRWGSGKWDTGYVSAVGGVCVIRDERLWFYYAATRGDATAAFPKGKVPGTKWRDIGIHFNASIGVASLRRDGFVGIVADGMGELTTKPVSFSGGRLFVNAECRFGSLTAEVLDADGNVLPGFSEADCVPFKLDDSTKTELRWRGGDLAKLAGRAVCFRFKLHCGTLYSFWVSKDATGKSGGYVAAGGPDYPGLRDL